MTILIKKDVDIPKCCKECKFKYAIGCRTYTGFHHQDTERAVKCPLVEVWYDCQKCVEALPAAQPERRVGAWIEYIPEHGKCPFCGNQVDLLNGKANNFCGECGADMRGEQE